MDKKNAGGNAKGGNMNKGSGGTKPPMTTDPSKREGKDAGKDRGTKPAGKGK